ncbi:hypothetical protein DSO57_1018086 [Entomophthora muscae]|uniref:Uncharacterized protein n=1 Tax=Entomophthora muscae TaxID=34485 RepID=A0ACC2RVL8_9FUNG|nr:hypothetical protein DSO57_1018086 [Entomophthora muscae]
MGFLSPGTSSHGVTTVLSSQLLDVWLTVLRETFSVTRLFFEGLGWRGTSQNIFLNLTEAASAPLVELSPLALLTLPGLDLLSVTVRLIFFLQKRIRVRLDFLENFNEAGLLTRVNKSFDARRRVNSDKFTVLIDIAGVERNPLKSKAGLDFLF